MAIDLEPPLLRFERGRDADAIPVIHLYLALDQGERGGDGDERRQQMDDDHGIHLHLGCSFARESARLFKLQLSPPRLADGPAARLSEHPKPVKRRKGGIFADRVQHEKRLPQEALLRRPNYTPAQHLARRERSAGTAWVVTYSPAGKPQ